jgi:mono/diheme cytochrome c family protein
VKLFTAALFLCIPVVVNAQAPDIGRGRALYENHCQACHTPGVHSRINRLAITRAEVRELVDNWQSQQALRWHDQDIEDVVEFLDRTRYRFK